jgi:hypothetical protein
LQEEEKRISDSMSLHQKKVQQFPCCEEGSVFVAFCVTPPRNQRGNRRLERTHGFFGF